MPILARAMFSLVNWAARKGLADSSVPQARTAAAGRKARRMKVDFQNAADLWEEVQTFLRTEIAPP